MMQHIAEPAPLPLPSPSPSPSLVKTDSRFQTLATLVKTDSFSYGFQTLPMPIIRDLYKWLGSRFKNILFGIPEGAASPLILARFPDDEPRASPRPRLYVREGSTFMQAVEDWTPRMKREYLREQARQKQGHYDQFEGWERYYYEYDYDYDYAPPKRYPSHDYDYDDVPPTPGWTHDYSESWSSHYDAEPGYEDVYPREPRAGFEEDEEGEY